MSGKDKFAPNHKAGAGKKYTKAPESPTPTPNPLVSDGSISNILQALNLHTSSQDLARQEYDDLLNEQNKFEKEFPEKFKEQCGCSAIQRQELEKKCVALKGDEDGSPLFRSLFSARKLEKVEAMGLSLDAVVDFWLLNHTVENYRKLKKRVTKVEVKERNSNKAAEGHQKQQPNKGTGVNIPVKVEKAKIDHHQPERKADDRPTVIYKEVVAIPDGHMLVKVSDYHKLKTDPRNSNESVEERSSRKPNTGNLSRAVKERIKELHYRMVLDLLGYMDPSIGSKWMEMTTLLQAYFKPVEIKKMKDMNDVCEKMLTTSTINYGQYEKLKNIFSSIGHQLCCDIVDNYSKQIEECQQP